MPFEILFDFKFQILILQTPPPHKQSRQRKIQTNIKFLVCSLLEYVASGLNIHFQLIYFILYEPMLHKHQ